MKTNRKYKSALLITLSLLLVFGSCKDYLKEKPSSQFTAYYVYNTADGLESGVVGLYNFQRAFWENLSNNGSNPIVIDAKDDLTIPRGGEISNYGRMNSGTTPLNSGVYSDYWKTYYRIIDRSNAIIKSAETITNMEEARKTQVIAQAKFFRANAVFTLFKLFNNIYVTTEPTTPENANKIITDKTPVAAIYKLVNDDLTYAIANLPWKDQFGRITQATARHVKAEVALWQKDWPEAKLQAEAVINNGAYKLVAQPGLVFKGDLNNTETLWALQFKAQVNGKPNKINFNLMPNYAELIPGSKYTIEQGGRGFGWLTLNNYLRDLLNADPNDTRIKGAYYVQDYVYNDPATIPSNVTLGQKIIHPDWKEFASTAANRNFWFIRLNAGCKKYFPDNGIPTEDTQTKNIMVYRLAETYLYAAEANMMLGNIGSAGDAANSGTALGQLNAIRTRASAAKVNTINIQTILDEQARELAFEGRRWYMLKRTGKLYDFVVNHAGYGLAGDLSPDNSTAGGANNTTAKPLPYKADARRIMKPYMVNWAIPLNEISLLGPNYPQNDGYN
ncbi:MAG: RagB/SusD family nutrient uptake outer membrane protein [Bacteroidetes bacterium]|nr:RagB/SusD family nutrient uptake outer membrane protein [Bacteroidota bacterium]MBU1486008.1 RagB/SusD family nutrient uptake outer membrane protein [Bacteroidota bacterium]MBU2267608.1 RagB/SusD family nutrient uptake outer membrane protein [Bacteroidota bacterium]MBU2376502.1 RagB/SusD family nutrient uptake outer membrane protein [Bacteroidota bacterium]